MSGPRFLVDAWMGGAALFFLLAGLLSAPLKAQEPAAMTASAPPPDGQSTAYIQEYRILGAKKLPQIQVEEAVYPYLGPGRTPDDVEQARAALEQAYHDNGYQTVSVQIPQQQVRRGIIVLQVVEAPVGRLRVRGSRYYSLDEIKKGVPSLAEGEVPNFNDVTREIVEFNQVPGRSITPSIRPGLEDGTYDVDLNVTDSSPLHGSVELNNRYSANTTPLRLNTSLSYENLWQMGHTIGFMTQIAPERLSDAVIYSGYYTARLPSIKWLSLTISGTRQNSNVSTIGGGAVAGNGEIIGGRLNFTLPSGTGFYQSLSFGIDYKNFTQDITIGGEVVPSPVTYYPFSLTYNGAWASEGSVTELNAGVTWSFRDLGTDSVDFDNRRYNADTGFFYFRGSLAHTRDLPGDFQIYGSVQGQASNQPLVDSEQFAGGGLDTVRGYLESEVLGDSAAIGSLELRSPSVSGFLGINEWRVYGFIEGGVLTLNDPLPEQVSQFNLASMGGGSRIKLLNHLNGSIDAGVPLITQSNSKAGSLLLTFRLWGDF